MKHLGVAALALAGALVALPAAAQYPPPPPGAPPAPPPGAEAAAPLYTAPQLDQMLAPIALYPDPLLTEILTASTYPLEVVAAARWQATNAGLTDGALTSAVEGQGWDPSVESLTAFPQVLAMMNQHLDWMQAIGNAFLAQQQDVMASIQRLRQEAQAAGTLASNQYETVTMDGPYIVIEPANPQLLYVPVYNPLAVYGAWPYPTYQPYYFGPPPGLAASFMVGALGFSIGIGIVDALWNWGDWDWRDHNVRVDPSRFAALEPRGSPAPSATWQHNPAHRRGVPYRDAASRAAYQRPVAATPSASRQQFRFYPEAGAAPAARASAPAARAPAAAARAPAVAERAPAARAPAPAARAPAPVARAPVAEPPRPSAFVSASRGPAVRAEAARGAASLQSRPAPIQVAHAAPPRPAPAARPAPAPAAARPPAQERRP
jgi:Protein of unknown function (DUF3300)